MNIAVCCDAFDNFNFVSNCLVCKFPNRDPNVSTDLVNLPHILCQVTLPCVMTAVTLGPL